MTFDRIVEGGEVEQWVSELLTNPSMMARQEPDVPPAGVIRVGHLRMARGRADDSS